MRQVSEDLTRSVLRMLDSIARAKGLSISDLRTQDAIREHVLSAFSLSRPSPIEQYGARTELMFAYAAAALGKCQVISLEDSDPRYIADPDATPPDYRLLLNDGSTMFVEVKNRHSTVHNPRFSIRKADADRLVAYSKMFDIELRIAIYWSAQGWWTLVRLEDMCLEGDRYTVRLHHCLLKNSMLTLGDVWIGVPTPLTIEFSTETISSIQQGDSETLVATIKKVRVYCRENEILNTFEQQLAFFFMMYGRWVEDDTPAEYNDGDLKSFRIEHYTRDPHEREGSPFSFIGTLGDMISRPYGLSLTTDNGQVKALRLNHDPALFSLTIPDNYRGEVLHMWRFHVQPNYS